MAPPKRKRNDRASVDSGENRPSPHRPGNTNLGQHDRGPDMRDTGRRSSRGGQGGGGSRGRRNDRNDRMDRDNPNNLTIAARATPTPGPMSPPPPPPPSSATQTPTPTFEQPNIVPKRDPAPFDYHFLTDDRLSSWDASGRQEVIATGIQARVDEDTTDIASIFQELVRAVLDGRLDSTDGGNCVKEILGPATAPVEPSSKTFDAPTFFLDTLSMIYDAEEGPFNPVLRPFTVATGVSPIVMRQKFDAQLLQNLGLTRDTFIRVGIRQATHLLYRQANFNLLREETEGYSKLVTELFPATQGSEPPSNELVENAFERVKGLIGTFDLDVGRVLDITLDVFAAVLIKHYQFFVKLLRTSSWWPRNSLVDGEKKDGGLPAWALPDSSGLSSTPEGEEVSRMHRVSRDKAFWVRARDVGLDAFFELGGRRLVDAESRERIFSSNGDADAAELDADRQWIEGTGTLPPTGNRVAAQLLGFKLRFYASSARDKDDILPPNLIYLTALLIKIGFISLRDLYPHLWPLDEDMPAVREARQKDLAEKEKLNRPGGGASNALMMAGALVDDTLPNGGRSRDTATTKPDAAAKSLDETEDKEKTDEPADQKVALLICLLTIGAVPEALFILGRFPWLPEAYPELFDLINRILHYSIKDVYDASRPTAAKDSECPTKKVADNDQNGVPKGQVRLVQIPARKPLRWPFPDKFDTGDNLSYRFYWHEWTDNIPLCQNVDDIFTLCSTLLNYSGVNIGRDASLLSKLVRIGAKSLEDDNSQPNLDRWQDLLKRILVPALSMTKSNVSVANEIYEMLRRYTISVRYSIYAEWFEGQISRLPAMKVVFARTKLETMSTMKRISKTNLTEMARALAKTAYASPGIVFSVALGQIEAYTNLTEVVVECAKYFTDLGYDVLVWSLMSSLGARGRDRNNVEFSLLPSRWLVALSRFAGQVFKKYSFMNLSPIVKYVDHQLFNGISTDLVILKELISQMAGVVPDTDFTDAQLTAMTGGEVLRRQTLINLQDKRFESTKTAKRLMKALLDTQLAGPLLLSIAQHRQRAIYSIPDEDAHIKLLATMIDDTQLIFFQYLDLLRSNLPVEDFDRHVPGLPELLTNYGLDPPLAFMIGRASIAYRLSRVPFSTTNGSTKALQSPSPPKVDAGGDVGMGTSGGDGVSGSQTDVINGDSKSGDDMQMVDLKDASTSQPDTRLAALIETPPDADPCYDVVEPIVSAVGNLPQSSWNAFSPEFYVTFWISTLSDLSVPSDSYQAEISRLTKAQEALLRDRSDLSRQGIVRRDEKKKEMVETRESLIAEMSNRVESYGAFKARLLKPKSRWFENSMKADPANDAFLEKCLVPRLLLSPSDADFCFKMIRFLHDNNTPYFRMLSLYGRIFKTHRLRSIIFTCTVREAENLGRFLRLALTDLARWHANAAVFEREAWGKGKNLPGFAKSLNNDGTPKGFLQHDNDGEVGFRNILLSWHKNLNSALRECFDGTEWMHIRNAVTVLKSVTDVFPAIDFMGNNFIKQLEVITIREKGNREDLSLTGNAVLVQLKKRSKKWVMVQAFGSNKAKVNGATLRSTSQASGPNSRTALKPTAPEFTPQSRASSQGVPTSKPTEVEDGEVDDAKLSGAASATNVIKSAPESRGTPEASLAASTAPSTNEPKKSDILLRREQIQRENAAKALAQSPSNPLDRSENSRNFTPTSLPDRGPHNLPSRPELPFPDRQPLDRHRHGDRRDARDGRDRDARVPRLPDLNRLDRPGDRTREYPPNDRRGAEITSRDFGRPSDRSAAPERERVRLDPPRWTADSARENSERAANNARMNESSGRLSRETAMPPPRIPAASSDRGPNINPERLSQVNPERQEIINPERAALISGGNASEARSDSPRRLREERDRPSPRQQSPRRHQSDRDHSDSRREDRTGRNGPSDNHSASRARIDEPVPAPPAGPRGDRSVERTGERGDRSSFQPIQPQPRPVDLDHGRLNNTNTRQQQSDPNFGRLNTTAQDIPSGPRDRNSRARNPSRRESGRVTTEMPRPPTPEMQPPTGPSGRHPRRTASGQFDPAPITANSLPTTPAAAPSPSPSISVHPDRLKHLAQGPQPSPSTPQSANQSPAPPMYQDRSRAFGNETPPVRPPPSQVNSGNSRPHMPSVVIGGPPSGPKASQASQASPITPGANGLAAPTGPASGTERNNRGRQRGGNQISSINNLLQQGGQQNAPDRGHRGRGSARAGGPPEMPTSASAVSVPPPPPIARLEGRDMGRDTINSERVDLITGSSPAVDDRDRERSSRRHQSGRHSRRNSKSPDRPRDMKRGPPEEERAARSEHRDRRNDRGDGERERHVARTPPRDIVPGRDLAGGAPRESGRDRERDRDSGRRDGREREGHEATWPGEKGPERGSGGRTRDARGDERRDGRGREDSGRKRRSEEGAMESRGHDKRPRRN